MYVCVVYMIHFLIVFSYVCVIGFRFVSMYLVSFLCLCNLVVSIYLVPCISLFCYIDQHVLVYVLICFCFSVSMDIFLNLVSRFHFIGQAEAEPWPAPLWLPSNARYMICMRSC